MYTTGIMPFRRSESCSVADMMLATTGSTPAVLRTIYNRAVGCIDYTTYSPEYVAQSIFKGWSTVYLTLLNNLIVLITF